MLADLAGRDDVIAFDLFGDLDLRADRVVKRRSLTALVDAAMEEEPGDVSTARASRTTPSWSSGWPSGTRCWATRRRCCAPCAIPSRLAAVLGTCTPGVLHAAVVGRWLRKPLRGGGGIAGARVARRRAAGRDVPAGAHRRGPVLGGCDRRREGCRRARAQRAARGTSARSACADTAGAGTSFPPRVPVPLAQPQAICSRLAAAFGLRGPFGVDFIWDGERAWSFEVNPRPTASLEVIEAVHALHPTPPPPASRAAGKAVVFATEDMVVGELLARRARRPAPRRADRQGPADLHRRDDRCDAASEALPGLEEQAACARCWRWRSWLRRRARGAAAPATTSS